MARHLHPRPPLEISRLRELGFSLWDPIGIVGLLPPGVTWDRHSTADEYDRYLVRLTDMLLDGATDDECIQVVADIETRAMQLAKSASPASLEQAATFVSALRRYVEETVGP